MTALDTTHTATTVPVSAYVETRTPGGDAMIYFARMLSKIRQHAAGTLHADFHENLGQKADAMCCNFLRVSYEALKAHVLAHPEQGDEPVLAWAMAEGRPLNTLDLLVWNDFCRKLGWNDFVSDILAQRKAESGLADRNDIETMPEYFEYDEGRKA